MRLLVIGGTRFSGWFLTRTALDAGHEVTTFTRGAAGAEGLDGARHLHGDRTEDLGPLAGGDWDAVIDTCGFVPRHVRAAAELLADRVGRYVYVSSISAYADASIAGLTEDAPTAEPPAPDVEEVTGDTYGGLKAACEAALREGLGDRATIVRPGLIVGPRDPTGRFTYWPERLRRGGPILAPAPPERPLQVIDARDLGAFLVRLAVDDTAGTFNAVGPAWPLTLGTLLAVGADAIGQAEPDVAWVDEGFLLDRGVEPWSELPLWIPAGVAAVGFQADVQRAVGAGLRFRPIADTVAATLAWVEEARAAGRYQPPAGTGMDPAREAELLTAWDGGRQP